MYDKIASIYEADYFILTGQENLPIDSPQIHKLYRMQSRFVSLFLIVVIL